MPRNADHEPPAEEVAAPKRLRSILDKEEG